MKRFIVTVWNKTARRGKLVENPIVEAESATDAEEKVRAKGEYGDTFRVSAKEY